MLHPLTIHMLFVLCDRVGEGSLQNSDSLLDSEDDYRSGSRNVSQSF